MGGFYNERECSGADWPVLLITDPICFIKMLGSAHSDVFKKLLIPEWICDGLIHLNVRNPNVVRNKMVTSDFLKIFFPGQKQ